MVSLEIKSIKASRKLLKLKFSGSISFFMKSLLLAGGVLKNSSADSSSPNNFSSFFSAHAKPGLPMELFANCSASLFFSPKSFSSHFETSAAGT